MKILIVDDHAIFREGLRLTLELAGGFDVVGSVAGARDAFPFVDACMPEVVVMDLQLSGMNGISATREIGRRARETRILILSAFERLQDVVDALEAGASGYALKGDPTEAVLEGVRAVGRGNRYLSPSLESLFARARLGRKALEDPLGLLSEREREVFSLACRAWMNAEIARELCISRKTVETHRYRIQKKLGVRNSLDLVGFAVSHGIFPRQEALPGQDSEAQGAGLPE